MGETREALSTRDSIAAEGAGNWTLERVAGELEGASKVFAAAHIMPDGDCIGSVLALGLALRDLGKTVTFALDDRAPETFNYLQGFGELAPRLPRDEDVFVFVDGSDHTRYGRAYDPVRIGSRLAINIDHHVTSESFADLNLVEVGAASTADIVYDLIRRLGAPITPSIAQCLLTGIVTDTLGFRTVGTTPETLERATELMRKGGSIPEIIDRVYNRRSFNSLRLLGYAIEHAVLEGPIIWSQVSQETLHQYGINGNGTGGIVNMLLSVADARVAFLLTEKDDGRVDVGLRSRPETDVSSVAYRLGGGGHKQASGTMLSGPIESAKARVLAEVKKELGIK
jgi:bifunctional oligoribonuclease and PAP phosphatase NrnA